MTTRNAEKKQTMTEQETIHPVMEEIKKDAKKKPESYIKNFTIPAEGE